MHISWLSQKSQSLQSLLLVTSLARIYSLISLRLSSSQVVWLVWLVRQLFASRHPSRHLVPPRARHVFVCGWSSRHGSSAAVEQILARRFSPASLNFIRATRKRRRRSFTYYKTHGNKALLTEFNRLRYCHLALTIFDQRACPDSVPELL